MNKTHIPLVIVGGGVVGLSIAYELLNQKKIEFCILDKEPYLGEHTSGRNSGVLHAGLYYSPDSLKKKFCIEGLELWRNFCSEHDLFFNKCGKYIFAPQKYEKQLNDLFERAACNGVDVRFADSREITEISRFCDVDVAFFSPNTAIIDPSQLIHFLKTYIERNDVPVLGNHKVVSVKKDGEKFLLELNNCIITCDFLINAAGHGAVAIRESLGLSGVKTSLVKGHYLKTTKDFYNKSLLYPLPEEDLKGLGVHTCIDSDGSIKFGPDTQDVEKLEYSMDKECISIMKAKVSKYFKINEQYLHADFAGIRPKILVNDLPFSDFWVNSPQKNYIELLGIESPGLTSALSLGKYIVKKLEI